MIEKDLEKLLSDMTIEEKIGQMTLLQISMFIEGKPTPLGPMVDMNITPEQMSLAGCIACNMSPEPTSLQK